MGGGTDGDRLRYGIDALGHAQRIYGREMPGKGRAHSRTGIKIHAVACHHVTPDRTRYAVARGEFIGKAFARFINQAALRPARPR